MKHYDLVVKISAPGISVEELYGKQEELITELNENGPVAEVLKERVENKTKGLVEIAGQVKKSGQSTEIISHTY